MININILYKSLMCLLLNPMLYCNVEAAQVTTDTNIADVNTVATKGQVTDTKQDLGVKTEAGIATDVKTDVKTDMQTAEHDIKKTATVIEQKTESAKEAAVATGSGIYNAFVTVGDGVANIAVDIWDGVKKLMDRSSAQSTTQSASQTTVTPEQPTERATVTPEQPTATAATSK